MHSLCFYMYCIYVVSVIMHLSFLPVLWPKYFTWLITKCILSLLLETWREYSVSPINIINLPKEKVCFYFFCILMMKNSCKDAEQQSIFLKVSTSQFYCCFPLKTAHNFWKKFGNFINNVKKTKTIKITHKFTNFQQYFNALESFCK